MLFFKFFHASLIYGKQKYIVSVLFQSLFTCVGTNMFNAKCMYGPVIEGFHSGKLQKNVCLPRFALASTTITKWLLARY